MSEIQICIAPSLRETRGILDSCNQVAKSIFLLSMVATRKTQHLASLLLDNIGEEYEFNTRD